MQTQEEMRSVIHGLRPGDRLRVVFHDRPVPGLAAYLNHIFLMLRPTVNALFVERDGFNDLKAASVNDKWNGCRAFVFVILGAFNADEFIRRTVSVDLLEKVEKVQ